MNGRAPASASTPAASGLPTITGTLATTSASSSPRPSATVWLIPKIIVIGSRRAYMPVRNASKLAISPVEYGAPSSRAAVSNGSNQGDSAIPHTMTSPLSASTPSPASMARAQAVSRRWSSQLISK